jgi:hypothetical protein
MYCVPNSGYNFFGTPGQNLCTYAVIELFMHSGTPASKVLFQTVSGHGKRFCV